MVKKKLKPFGFWTYRTYRAIDGYSQRIIWSEVGRTNNNPKIISNYFTDYIRQIGGVPRILRADAETENGYVAGLKLFLRSECEMHFQVIKVSCTESR